MNKRYSLRHRLLIGILGSSAVLWLVGMVVMFAVAWYVTSQTLDNALKEAGVLIIRATTDLHRRGVLPDPVLPEDFQADSRAFLQYQIIVSGQLSSRTAGAPSQPFLPYRGAQGFFNVKSDDQLWRVYAITSRRGGFEVLVGQRLGQRRGILRSVGARMIVPGIIWLGVLGLLSGWIIRRVLRPLDYAAAELANKSPQDLTPVKTDDMPDEFLPLADSLNRVLTRLDSALQSERRFTADAAHEMRTPLAALRTRAQLLQRQHTGLAEPIQKLLTDIDRCSALVGHLLLLARLDPMNPVDSGVLQREEVLLSELLGEIVTGSAAQAERQHITLRVECDADLSLLANRELLLIALRNLTDNALRYCPVGSEILFLGHKISSSIELGVYDSGPGVDRTQWVQLTQRFFRVLGNQQTGSGLGLSIVQHITELHHADLIIGDGLFGRGLGVTLRFPFYETVNP